MDPALNGVAFRPSRAGKIASRTLGRLFDSVRFGPWSGLVLEERAALPLPGPRWVRVRVIAAGICASDVARVTYGTEPGGGPEADGPAVPGHEIVGRVEERGEAVTDLEPGVRVVVDPLVPPHAPRSPGPGLGTHRDLPGGWGEEIVAHRDQLHLVEDLDDRTAVLVEPFAAATDALLRAAPLPAEAPILVAGSGPVALGAVWTLRAWGWRGLLVVWTPRPPVAALARRLGADEVATSEEEARDALAARPVGGAPGAGDVSPSNEESAGAPSAGPFTGGSEPLSTGGSEPLLISARPARGDSPVPARRSWSVGIRRVTPWCGGELGETGSRGRAPGSPREGAFRLTLELLRQARGPVGELVTHAFPLEQYRDALSAAADPGGSDAIRVVLLPGASGS